MLSTLLFSIMVLAIPLIQVLGGTLKDPKSISVVKRTKNTQPIDDQTKLLELLAEEENIGRSLRSQVKNPSSKRNAVFDEEDNDIKDFIEQVMACKDVPGLSVAVVKDGTSWTAGFGVKDLIKKDPVDTSTLFAVGSVTKAFTSALLAFALEEAAAMGKNVSWQTKVKDILGTDFQLTNNLEQEVTLADILAHRTGLMAADIVAVAGFPAGETRSQFLRHLRYLPDIFSLRQQWHYNNWMYALAGDVTERLLGDTWTSLLKERLLTPLAMDDSAIVWDDLNVTSPKIARPYHKINGSLQELDEILFEIRQGKPSGALAVSAEDMTKWMTLLLNGGVLPSGHRLIGKESMKEMMTSHMPMPMPFSRDDVPVEDKFEGYGYGWFTGSYREKNRISHTGGWFGYLASLALFPDDDVAVYVAISGPGTSAGSAAYRAVSYYLSDIALGYSPFLNQTTACALGEQASQDGQAADTDQNSSQTGENKIEHLERYIGTFSNPLFGDVVIQNSTEFYGLVLQFQRLDGFLIPGKREFGFQVQYMGKTAFYSFDNFDVQLSRLSFGSYNMTPDGKCTTLILRGPNSHERLEFTRSE